MNISLTLLLGLTAINYATMLHSRMKETERIQRKKEGREVREKGEIFLWPRAETKRKVFQIKRGYA